MAVAALTKKEMGKARTSPEILPEPKKKKSQPTQSKSQERRLKTQKKK